MSPIGHIFEDSQDLLRRLSRTAKASYTHVSRQANNVAHHQARNTLGAVSPCIWLDAPPGFIADVILEGVHQL